MSTVQTTEQGPAVDPGTFRETLARFPAGVTVLTVDHGDGWKGMTASAFTSVSLDPPLVLACVGKDARTHPLLRKAGAYGVSILAADQEAVSDGFAGVGPRADAPFDGLATRTLETGSPLLEDALAVLDCTVEDTVDAGDHTVFVGRVHAAEVQRPDDAPLVHWNRGYRHLANGHGGDG